MFCRTWVTISTDSCNSYFVTNCQDPKPMPHVVYALLEQHLVLVAISPQTSAIQFINVPNIACAQSSLQAQLSLCPRTLSNKDKSPETKQSSIFSKKHPASYIEVTNKFLLNQTHILTVTYFFVILLTPKKIYSNLNNVCVCDYTSV